MEERNHTSVTEFILLGLTDDPKLKIPLFLIILLFYIVTVVANFGIFGLIVWESRLHTPMYFFLSNLSLSDFFYSSVISPRMLKDLLSVKKSISFSGCATQSYFFFFLAGMEIFLLSVMAYDRYAAICLPLLYNLIMNASMCIKLLTVAYLSGILTAASHTACTFSVSFCGSNVIDHFYCDKPPLMKLACSDKFFREIWFFVVIFLFGFGALLVTVISYIYIMSTVLQIPSTTGKKKAFSTCGSHLAALSLFYGTTLFMYLRLPGAGSETQNKVVSVCYTTVIPMLNPLIYSVRNQEVKAALWKIIHNRWIRH